ncbi:hypothetical protein GCM10009772_44880 [Pseudonocardia alni subsp. carboxydivorans]|uniref:Ig-like domain-containing protein n=1 Tax=Pseudonocardia alni subsp. carboxydivorans TaxID=415010 RepID=A0ABU9AE55_PSEA5
MTGTLSVVMGGAGVVLLLVGLIGGGFTFSGSVMPTVGRGPRVACFAVGSVLLLLALVLGLADIGSKIPQAEPRSSDPGPPPDPSVSAAPAPFVASVLVPAGHGALIYSDPLSTAPTVGQVNSGVSINLFCSVQGEYVVNSQNVGSTLWYRTETGYVPDVNLNTGTNQSVTVACQ